jgi:ribosomal protein S18 acetylase RimI-like enzyme
MEVRELTIEDYDAVVSLWRSCEGIGLHSDVDSRQWLAMYLQRNPGLSFVAVEGGRVIGAVLCGHDGRRGYINHLAVAKDFHGHGIGAALAERVINRLRNIGIRKCKGFVFRDNRPAIEFYQKNGWVERNDLKVVSKSIIL